MKGRVRTAAKESERAARMSAAKDGVREKDSRRFAVETSDAPHLEPPPSGGRSPLHLR